MPWRPSSGTSSTPRPPVPSSYASSVPPPSTVTRRATAGTGEGPHRTEAVGAPTAGGWRAAEDAALETARAATATTATTAAAMRADRRYITSDIVVAEVSDVKEGHAHIHARLCPAGPAGQAAEHGLRAR